MTVDAIVVGAGPNGLVAANVLADHGWDVLVLEATEEPGGAVRTAEITAPGFRNDVFSSFYPMTAVSPVFRDLELERQGLRWTHAPAVLAHPRSDGPTVMMHRDVARTALSLDADHPGDGASYRRVYDAWCRVAEPIVDALMSPFPPVRHGARLVARAGVDQLRELARLAIVPLRRFGDESFGGEGGKLLFAGTALHADLTPESAGSAMFGWLLTCIGQQVGFPVPVGGAGEITAALVARLRERGGQLRCTSKVERVIVRGGRAVGVVTEHGEEIDCRRAVLADCEAAGLYLNMVGREHLPPTIVERIMRMERSSGTFKVDWALSSPVPWTDPQVGTAGTVHLADSVDELSVTANQLAMGQLPHKPFMLVGQNTTADPSRSPAGTEAMWAYTHVPQVVRGDAGDEGVGGEWSDDDRERFAERMEGRIERLAPGFRDRIVGRHVMSPRDMQRINPNLVGGDLSGGTSQLHQQLIFRPIPGWGRPETPIDGLYLASASAHPGGAVHGACGNNAARAALLHDRVHRWLPLPMRSRPHRLDASSSSGS